MTFHWRNFVLLGLMSCVAVLSWAMRPTQLISDLRPKVELEKLVPTSFGSWREIRQSSGQIVNPQQQEKLEAIYSQTLSRTYVSDDGQIVMLSIAYGVNQSDGVALHYPEVCYPAQGFQLLTNVRGTVTIGKASIPVRRLTTRLGNRREPVTYWSTLGDQVVLGGMATKLAQIKYGFQGQIPDGLLFRVSSISGDPEGAFETHEKFASDLMASLSDEAKVRFVGKP